MDQDSASGGKGSWRDRLGISKDDAENQAETLKKAAPEAPRMAPRAPLAPAPAGRAAPMAPRAPLASARPATLGSRSEPAAAGTAVSAAPPRATASAPATAPRSPASEGLAERLRVQREAAERLAEQRLALARQRAAARVQETKTATDTAKLAAPAQPAAIESPAPVAPSMSLSSDTPDTPDTAPAAASSPAAQPRFGFASDEISRAQRAPLAPSKPLGAAPPPRSQLAAPLSAPVKAPEARPEPRLDATALRGSLAPSAPRAPLRPRPAEAKPDPAFTNDFGDDFEEGFLDTGNAYEEPRPVPAPARAPLSLASVNREAQPDLEEEQYFTADRLASMEKDTTRSKTPVLLLGSLLGIIVLFAIGIFVWQQMPSSTVSAPVEAEVPVVAAPAEPVKTVPLAETTAEDADAAAKKQFYDRILGDEEQADQPSTIVPSEELPVPQEAAPESSVASPEPLPAAEAPAAEAASEENSLPIPAEPEPEPEAPGPSGALDDESPDPFAAVLPVPAEANMAETVVETVVETPAASVAEAPATPAQVQAVEAPAAPAPIALIVPPKPKPRPVALAKPVAPALPPSVPANEQVASVDPVAPVPTVTAYVAQLASLNTENDAKAEFTRVRSAHSAIVGSLTPVITKADLGTKGTIFRLGLGPLASKEAASKLCAQLIAAGEKDCIVRRQ